MPLTKLYKNKNIEHYIPQPLHTKHFMDITETHKCET